MRRPLALALAVPFAFSLVAAPRIGLGAITTGYSSDGSFPLTSGVNYEWGTLQVDQKPRDIDVVEIDPTNPHLDVRLSIANDSASSTRTVTDQALAYSQDGRRVVASVNGSLFSFLKVDGTPVGGMGLGYNVSDGEVINAGQSPERTDSLPAFAITAAGLPIIGYPDIDMQLTLPGSQEVRLDRINQVRSDGQAVLYSPRLGTHTWTNDLGNEYVIDGFDLPLRPTGTYTGTVAEVRVGAGDTPIGAGQVVLSVSETATWPATLAVGDQVTLSISTVGAWGSVRQSVGGRDMLVVGGHSVVPQPDADGRHARTALGIRADGTILMVTADSGSYVSGLNLQEIAGLMISLGAVDALNLDGGVSSQMAVRLPGDAYPSPVNTQTKPVDRPVVNALQVVTDLPDGALDRLLLLPADTTAAAGQTVHFTVKGQDADLNGIPIDTGELHWDVSASGGGGAPSGTAIEPTVDGAAITISNQGDYMVTVRLGSEEASARLSVVDDTDPPIVSIPEVSLADVDGVGVSAAYLYASWTAVDNVAVTQAQVQRKIDAGRWRSVSLADEAASTASVPAPFGRRVQFRVRATDAAGNTSAWTLSRIYRLSVYDEGNTTVTRAGTWRRKVSDQAIGGGFLRSRTSGSSLATLVNASQVAIIGSRGPGYGQADVYIDGALVSSSAVAASALQYRRVIYLSGPLSDLGKTTIRVVDAGAGVAPLLDVDAFLVLVPID